MRTEKVGARTIHRLARRQSVSEARKSDTHMGGASELLLVLCGHFTTRAVHGVNVNIHTPQ